jgi:hypothetical protein
VDTIISVDSDAFGEYYRIKIQARLINGWRLHVREHVTPSVRRYAYHVSKGSELIIRRDNATHHRKIKTFPHHKHFKEDVLESNEVVLEEIRQMVISHCFYSGYEVRESWFI